MASRYFTLLNDSIWSLLLMFELLRPHRVISMRELMPRSFGTISRCLQQVSLLMSAQQQTKNTPARRIAFSAGVASSQLV
jgi:hypothetical protein